MDKDRKIRLAAAILTTAAFLLFAVRVIADICCRISTGYPMLFALGVVNVFVWATGSAVQWARYRGAKEKE